MFLDIHTTISQSCVTYCLSFQYLVITKTHKLVILCIQEFGKFPKTTPMPDKHTSFTSKKPDKNKKRMKLKANKEQRHKLAPT